MVTVTTPADAGETSKPVPKFTVPIVPTSVPPSLMIIPLPDAVIPVSPEPSPTNVALVVIPVQLMLATKMSGLPSSPCDRVAIPAEAAYDTLILLKPDPSPVNDIAVRTPTL